MRAHGRGLFAGVLGLVALQAVLGTSDAAGRVGGLFRLLDGALERLLDPTVAAIPDRRKRDDGAAQSSAETWTTRPATPDQPTTLV